LPKQFPGRLPIAVVGVDLMTKANPGARKSIAVIETRFEADESLAAGGEQHEMAATEDR
jgi:hypothetical protein